MVQSASITSRPTDFEQVYLSRHLAFLALGVLAAAVASVLPATFWFKAAPWLLLATVILLVLVLIPGVGTRVNGAQRWLRFGSWSLQPSELAKLALPLFLCRAIELRRGRLREWLSGTLPVLWPVAIVVPLVAREPDLGTALFLTSVAGLTLFAGGWPLRNFIIGTALAAPAAGFLLVMKPYQMERITGFVNTWSDFNHAPYQLKQSLVTLGAGGVSGVGIGNGWQKLSFLPEANTDFIFAVVGEELGLIGTLGLIALWTAVYVSGLRLIAPLARSGFAWLASFILLTQLVLQAAINVAVVTAMVPPKGISHPLVSYGGSSLVVSLVSLGVILSLARRSDSAQPAADGLE